MRSSFSGSHSEFASLNVKPGSLRGSAAVAARMEEELARDTEEDSFVAGVEGLRLGQI